MSFRVFLADIVHKHIESMQMSKYHLIAKIQRFDKMIEEEQKTLQKMLNKLSKKESLDLGYRWGYIEDADYKIAMQKVRRKK